MNYLKTSESKIPGNDEFKQMWDIINVRNLFFYTHFQSNLKMRQKLTWSYFVLFLAMYRVNIQLIFNSWVI